MTSLNEEETLETMALFGSCFLKLFYIHKTRRTGLVPSFFFILKNIENTENTKFRKQEQFSENTTIVFCVFKNYSQVVHSHQENLKENPLQLAI